MAECGVLQFTEAVVNLKFDEEPKYAAYSALFEGLCGAAASRPVLQTEVPKVQITLLQNTLGHVLDSLPLQTAVTPFFIRF